MRLNESRGELFSPRTSMKFLGRSFSCSNFHSQMTIKRQVEGLKVETFNRSSKLCHENLTRWRRKCTSTITLSGQIICAISLQLCGDLCVDFCPRHYWLGEQMNRRKRLSQTVICSYFLFVFARKCTTRKIMNHVRSFAFCFVLAFRFESSLHC